MSNETLDRVRRIETMLCRHIEGKPDKRTTKYNVEVWNTTTGWEVETNSMGISLQAVVDAARAAGCAGEEFLICDNGKPRLIVREICDTVTK